MLVAAEPSRAELSCGCSVALFCLDPARFASSFHFPLLLFSPSVAHYPLVAQSPLLSTAALPCHHSICLFCLSSSTLALLSAPLHCICFCLISLLTAPLSIMPAQLKATLSYSKMFKRVTFTHSLACALLAAATDGKLSPN